jgi:hypothetical protein
MDGHADAIVLCCAVIRLVRESSLMVPRGQQYYINYQGHRDFFYFPKIYIVKVLRKASVHENLMGISLAALTC